MFLRNNLQDLLIKGGYAISTESNFKYASF